MCRIEAKDGLPGCACMKRDRPDNLEETLCALEQRGYTYHGHRLVAEGRAICLETPLSGRRCYLYRDRDLRRMAEEQAEKGGG